MCVSVQGGGDQRPKAATKVAQLKGYRLCSALRLDCYQREEGEPVRVRPLSSSSGEATS